MQSQQDIFNLLRRKNPFATSSAGNPADIQYPDVETIHKNAFALICRLLRQKDMEPAESLSALLLGELGTGKTHLAARLFRYTKNTSTPNPVVYLICAENRQSPFLFLLKEVVVALNRPLDPQDFITHLDVLLAGIFKEQFEVFGKNHTNSKFRSFLAKIQRSPVSMFQTGKVSEKVFSYVEKTAKTLLLSRYPQVSDVFFSVLFQYRAAGKRHLVVNWLKGAPLSPQDAGVIGVYPEKAGNGLSEQEAKDFLGWIGALVSDYTRPVLMCFDRLENLETTEAARNFSKVMEFLTDSIKGVFPVVLAREKDWNRRLRQILNDEVVTRLETNVIRLARISFEEAMEIIKTRVYAVVGDIPFEEDFPLQRQRMRDILLGPDFTPREVITSSNQELVSCLEKRENMRFSPADQLVDAFENRYLEILMNFDSYPPDKTMLQAGLSCFLQHATPKLKVEIESFRPGKRKNIDMVLRLRLPGASPVSAVFLIADAAETRFLCPCLESAIDFLQLYPTGKAFFILDARLVSDNEPQDERFAELAQRFASMGGIKLVLDKKGVAALYSLAGMEDDAGKAGIFVMDAKGLKQAVGSEDFIRFLEEEVPEYQVFRDLCKMISGEGQKGIPERNGSVSAS